MEHYLENSFIPLSSQSLPPCSRRSYCFDFFHHRLILSVLKLLINGLKEYELSCVKLFLSQCFEDLPVICVNSLFLLVAECGIPLFLYHNLLIWAIMNKPYDHSYSSLFVGLCFHFSWVDTKEWDYWVMWNVFCFIRSATPFSH